MSDFQQLIEFIRKEVNRGLKNISIPEKPNYLYDPIRYSIRAKGKRFRPILVHLVGRAYKVDPNELMSIALSVELLHNFTLIHDDIMDNDDMRHGQETIHSKWDQSTAILAGDGIYTLAQILLSSLPKKVKELCKSFNYATLEVCEGQALDKEFENDSSITEDQYLEMVGKKTGALLSVSTILPAKYSDVNSLMIENYENFGYLLGKGFQIHDDLLEIFSGPEVMGKSLGSDILEGKQTIMVIKARSNYPKEWSSLLNNKTSQNKMEKIQNFFIEKGIKKDTENLANSFFNKAKKTLEDIKDVDSKELYEFVNLVENRNF